MGSQWEAKVKEILDSKGHRTWGKGEAKTPLSISPHHFSLLVLLVPTDREHGCQGSGCSTPSSGTERAVCLEGWKSRKRSLIGSS